MNKEELSKLYDDIMNSCDLKIENSEKEIIKSILDEISLDENNRIIVPALWDKRVIHLLPNNFWLCKNILNSIHKRYKNDPNKLEQYDSVIAQQLRDNIISPSEPIEILKDRKDVSFIAHKRKW